MSINFPYRPFLIGNGHHTQQVNTLYCKIGPNDSQSYHDAQISDYEGLPRSLYPWRPPLRLRVRAWGSADIKGTAGFGFWNQPFMPGEWSFHLPQALWFFYASPPSNIALAKDVPGYGWKAATFDAATWSFMMLAPVAPLGFLLMRIPHFYHRLWPLAQRAIKVSEHLLTASLSKPHTYELIWHPKEVLFLVDGRLVHYTYHSPCGPLGFVAWIDNQYAVVTPQGQFKMGVLALKTEQWLALESIEIIPER